MNKTCLVTGGAGFIGCALSARLAEMFDTVVAVDNMHPQIHATPARPAALHDAVRLVVADVTERGTWDDLLSGFRPDVVFHLAAETGTGQSLTEATRHANVNAVGTTQMMDALVRHDAVPQQVVLTSSRAVYGEGAWTDAAGAAHYPGQRSKDQLERKQWNFPGLVPTPSVASTTIPNPTSVYGAMKLAQEWLLKSWALSFGVDLKILRLQNVYGPGQSLTNSYTGIVSLFARLAREGKSIPVYEDGDILRDFVLIDDVADAILAISQAPPGTPCLDVGSGKATSILDLAKTIASRYGAPAPHINGMFRNGDVRAAWCDIAAIAEALGWSPKYTVEAGTDRLCRWIDEQSPEPTRAAPARVA